LSVLRAGRVEVAAGDGVLARRPDALLFVARPLGAATPWTAVLDAFVGAPDASTALATVLDHAVDQHLEVGPFAVVVWTTAAHLVVFGDLTITSDLSSVPRLSGAGTPTWVEHRATRLGEHSEVRLGEAVTPGTDLVAGIVPAGGFRLTLLSPSIQPVPDRPPAPAGDTAAPPVPAPPSPPAPPPPPEAEPPAGAPASWEVLRDAGGAWMDESLQLSEPRRPAPGAPPAPTPVPAPAPSSARQTAAPASGVTASQAFDPEVTLDAGVLAGGASPSSAPPEPGPLSRYVQARRCDLGHLNPPLRTRCRTCDHYLPPATPVETVPQPALAMLVLGDGRTVDVAGPVVLGRTPSAEAARLDEPGTLVAVGDATVSRTHAVVTVDGWTLLATDCGATGGTAIATSGGDPALLEPWVPHELAIGDTLFLGGPTKVQVVRRDD
jgi:hypothetical protein